jgi:N-acetylglucosaminyl-diphospho-decaprenol L-rhamnosyltransferase
MTIDGEDRPVPQLPPEPPAWKLVVGIMPLVSKLIRPPPFVPEAGPPLAIDWMPALCAVMFRREALERINGFDPNYFLGWEEWDIARRIQEAGYGIRLHRSAEIVHTGLGSTPRTLSKWRAKHGRHSLCYHLRKYHGSSWYAAGRVACGIASLRHQLPIRPT